MDALTCFTNLGDNIPHWLTKLDQLATQVADQHTRFTTLTHFTELGLRKRHDSTESLRPKNDDENSPKVEHDQNVSSKNNNKNDNDTAMVVDALMPSGQLGISNVIIDSTVILRDVRRKRKPRSSFSGASGPRQYRTRSMVIVYYDSAIQEAFESLVRNIASARNNLRKGKTEASFKARMASLGMDETLFAGGGDLAMLNPKMMRSRFQRSSQQTPPTEYVPAFEEADQHLEAAQSLCEVAAHQFLRDGDCSDEIEGTKARFQNCLSVAQREADVLRQRKSQESSELVAEDNPDEPPRVVALDEKVDLSAVKASTYADVGTIEVDNESDASSAHIDLSALRRARRA